MPSLESRAPSLETRSMERTKECSLCGELMRIQERETVEVVPGSNETKKIRSREWVCPECDNFEEVEDLPRQE